jgi:hypothetical protein
LVIVEARIVSLNEAVTWAVTATPVTAGKAAAGEVAVTVGTRPAPGVPRIGSSPLPLQAASNIAVRHAVMRPLVAQRWFNSKIMVGS